jgi:dipeptidase D
MASALSVLADDSVEHGPLEVLLTMTEEAGMDGAFGLQANWLQADILINTDSEEEVRSTWAARAGLISSLPCRCPVKRYPLASRPSS